MQQAGGRDVKQSKPNSILKVFTKFLHCLTKYYCRQNFTFTKNIDLDVEIFSFELCLCGMYKLPPPLHTRARDFFPKI